jgi:ATP-dependent helicase/nuclease subunit A
MSKKTPATDTRTIDRESRRIIRGELLTNILVEAGAGSGKTQMLAERMAAGVAAGVYQVEHMAAVTFTRKAASELRGRFHLALEKDLISCSDDFGRALSPADDAGRVFNPAERSDDVGRDFSPAERASRAARVRAALGNLERFFAGTIHSFCARLLRERPVESGVSPGFTELDEVQDLELRKRAWRDFVTNMRSAGDRDMFALLEADVRPGDLDSAFATICQNDDVDFPSGDAECPDPKAAWKGLEKFWKEVQKHLPSTIDAETTCPIQKAARDFRGQLNVSSYRLDRPSVIASLLNTWDCESKITQYRWADSTAEKKRLRDLINPLHEAFVADVVEPYLSQWRQYVYRLSVTLLSRARAHAAAERRRLNSLNYGDLLILAARVLRENAAVRRSLQQKYRHLFVDEFQDTNPVQAEIVFLLAADEFPQDPVVSAFRPHRSAGGPAEALAEAGRREEIPDWRKVQLRPGALFVVGDPKQSIYRFRRADIDIYNVVRARFSAPSVGRVLPLTMNFRSVAELCDWANGVFKTRFPADATAHSPQFAALDAKDTTVSGGVFTLTHSCESSELLERDAERIATFIRSEVDAGRRKFSDFLILTRKKRNRIVPYASALEALNVPIEVSGAGAFGESAEVAALTVLLRALSDPEDQLALIAVLRGPVFGISDRELFAYKQSGGWFSIFSDASTPHAETTHVGRAFRPAADPVSTALTAMRQYYRWTRMLPAAAALDRILEHTGYLALASTSPGGVEAGDLLHAVDRVRQVVEEGSSLADAADALEADSEERNEVESLPLEPGRTDVVRVMNLHKAKGLEADVVFLADPAGGFAPRVDVHIKRTDTRPQGWFKVERRNEDKPWMRTVLGEHADWPQHEAAEFPYLKAEEDRLLYVAATRARQMLVVSRFTGRLREPAWGVVNEFLTGAPELPVPTAVHATVLVPLDCSARADSHASTARSAAHQRTRRPSWSMTSVTAEAKRLLEPIAFPDAVPDDATRVVSQDSPSHRADAGLAWGTLIHGLLEHAMRHESSSRNDLRRLAMWLTVEEPLLRPLIDLAVDTVQQVAKETFWAVARRGVHSVETPFITTDDGRLTTGVIDLMFESPVGWQIVDYKTDRTPEHGKYAQQLEAYKAALGAVGRPVADATVVSVRTEAT